ncbi:hypothetical protein CONCODRAFT_10985, partial [Conidiobolus coronatus NRRL 28638]
MTNLQPKLWSQFNKLKRKSEKSLIKLLNTDKKTLSWSPKLNLILLGIIIQFTSSKSNSTQILIDELWECINQKFKSYWLLETYEGLVEEVNVKGEVENFKDLVTEGDVDDSNALDNGTNGQENNSNDDDETDTKESDEGSEGSATESDDNMETDDNDNTNIDDNNKSNEIDINMDISMGEGEIVELGKSSPKEGDKAVDEPGESTTNHEGSTP